jgi:two-component system sensor histidine kinase/response regulator
MIGALSRWCWRTGFLISLEAEEPPVADPRPTALLAAQSAGENAPASKGRVLIVDDNAINQLVARKAVQRVGYEAAVGGDGAAALEMIAGSRFQVVLMDCQMPGMDGYQTTAEIRRRERAGERLPVVAMTANSVDGDRERCSAAGMDDYIGKPLRLADLAEMLERWVTPLETCGAAAASPGPAFPTPPDRPIGR